MRRLFRRGHARRRDSAERLPLGPWIDHRSQLDALGRCERLGLAAHAAALRLNPRRSESGDQRSVLRVEAASGGPVRVELGKVGAGAFQADWAVELHEERGDSVAALVVSRPDGRPVIDPPHGDEGVAALRASLAELLVEGPPIALLPGAPRTQGLTRVATLGVSPLAKARSPFDADFLIPPDPAFCPGAMVLFPGVHYDELRQLIAQLHIPLVGSSDGLGLVIDLSAGRGDHLALRVVSTPDGAALQVEYVEESLAPLTIHRAHRAAAGVLADLLAIDGRWGRVGRFAADALESWTAAQRSPRGRELVPTWTVRTSMDTVPLPLLGDLPVAVVCTSRDADLGPTLADAERWLSVRQCDWPGGPVPGDGSSSSHVTRRPVAPRRAHGSSSAVLRYGHSESNDLIAVPASMGPDWFWGVTLDSALLAGGRRRSTLVVDAMSSSHGVLSYGTELFTLFDAFVSLVRHRFPEAELATLVLTHDGPHGGADPARGHSLQPRSAPSTSSASSGRQMRRSGSHGSGSL